MTPPARLQASIELGAGIDAEGRPADAVIDAYFRRRRYAGGGDRRAVAERVYGVLRRRSRLDWWIDRLGGGLEAGPRSRIVADLVLCDGTTAEQVDALFDGSHHGPDPLSDAERRLFDAGPSLDHPAMPDWVALEYPRWLDRDLRRRWGDGLAAGMAALNRPAPLDVRVNTLKGDRRGAAESLAGDGVAAEPTPLSPLGLRLGGRLNLAATAAFRGGLIEVQDEGSQLIALVCGAGPGMTVVDYCAGAGGKTLALAAAMEGRGELVACDVSPRRLAAMDRRLVRAGAVGVRTRKLAVAGDPWIAAFEGRADRVLVDAPCSGTGVWRRDPGARWRLGPDDVESMVAGQRTILADAARLVRPGGRLVYATCSLLAGENEEQVAWFLDRHPGFAILPVAGAWAASVGGECPSAESCLRLDPDATGTDGFFAAILERRQ